MRKLKPCRIPYRITGDLETVYVTRCHAGRHTSPSADASWRRCVTLGLDPFEGAMHYRAALHPLYTSAAPVYDLLGQTVGVLAVIGRHEHTHPHTLGMITAAAQAISNQLQMQVWLNNAK